MNTERKSAPRGAPNESKEPFPPNVRKTSNIRNAIMFAFYDDAVDRLFKDDIEGIRALYGEP
jgi:hypothetical protein